VTLARIDTCRHLAVTRATLARINKRRHLAVTRV